MSNTILQYSCGLASNLLKEIEPYHNAYCDKWDAVYKPVYISGSCRKNIWYRKALVILEALNSMPDNSILLYLDLDALIIDFNQDVFNALPEDYDIGLVRVHLDTAQRMGLYNAGVQFIRVNQNTKDFYGLMVSTNNPYDSNFDDQIWLNRELKHSDLRVLELNSKYNDYQYSLYRPSGTTVIKAFHSEPEYQAYPKIKGILNRGYQNESTK